MQDKRGRPLLSAAQGTPLDSYSVRMTAWHARMARQMGGGNLSDGTRAAIEFVLRRCKEDAARSPAVASCGDCFSLFKASGIEACPKKNDSEENKC